MNGEGELPQAPPVQMNGEGELPQAQPNQCNCYDVGEFIQDNMYGRSMGDKFKDGFSPMGREYWKTMTGDDPNGSGHSKQSVQDMEHNVISNDYLFEDYGNDTTNLTRAPKFLFFDAGKYSLFTFNMSERFIVVPPAAIFDPATNWTVTNHNQTWPSYHSHIFIDELFMNFFLGTPAPHAKRLDIEHDTRWTTNINAGGNRVNTIVAEGACKFDIKYKPKGETARGVFQDLDGYRTNDTTTSITTLFHDTINRTLPITASNLTKTQFDHSPQSCFESHLGKELGDALQAVHMYIFACIYIEYGDGIDGGWQNGDIFTFDFGKIHLSCNEQTGKPFVTVENEPALVDGVQRTSSIQRPDLKEKTIKGRKTHMLMTTVDANVTWLVQHVFALPVYYSSGKRISKDVDDDVIKQQKMDTIRETRRVRKEAQAKIIAKLAQQLTNLLPRDVLCFVDDGHEKQLRTYIGRGGKKARFKNPRSDEGKKKMERMLLILQVAFTILAAKIHSTDPSKLQDETDDQYINKRDILSIDFVKLKAIKDLGSYVFGWFSSGKGIVKMVIDNVQLVPEVPIFERDIKQILKTLQEWNIEDDKWNYQNESNDYIDALLKTIFDNDEQTFITSLQAWQHSHGFNPTTHAGGAAENHQPNVQITREELTVYLNNMINSPIYDSMNYETLSHNFGKNIFEWIEKEAQYAKQENKSYGEINNFLTGDVPWYQKDFSELKVSVPFEHAYMAYFIENKNDEIILKKNQRILCMEEIFKPGSRLLEKEYLAEKIGIVRKEITPTPLSIKRNAAMKTAKKGKGKGKGKRRFTKKKLDSHPHIQMKRFSAVAPWAV